MPQEAWNRCNNPTSTCQHLLRVQACDPHRGAPGAALASGGAGGPWKQPRLCAASYVQLGAGRDYGHAPSERGGQRQVTEASQIPRKVIRPLRFHPVTDARCQQPSLHDPNSYASPRSPVPATVLSTQPSGLPLRGGRDLLPGACQDCSALLGLTANSPAGPQVLPEPGPPRQGSPHFTAPMLPLCSVSTAGLTPH